MGDYGNPVCSVIVECFNNIITVGTVPILYIYLTTTIIIIMWCSHATRTCTH